MAKKKAARKKPAKKQPDILALLHSLEAKLLEPWELRELQRQEYREGVRKGLALPLDESADLYVQLLDESADCMRDGKRFQGLFQSTWQCIPTDARSAILAHFGRQLHLPKVRLVGDEEMPDELEQNARVRHHFLSPEIHWTEIQFRSDYVMPLDDSHISDMIAHELAHVFQHAEGFEGSYDELERDAEYLSDLWGFDPNPPDDIDEEDWPIQRALAEKRRQAWSKSRT